VNYFDFLLITYVASQSVPKDINLVKIPISRKENGEYPIMIKHKQVISVRIPTYEEIWLMEHTVNQHNGIDIFLFAGWGPITKTLVVGVDYEQTSS
jgi:hypothetical protein